jgi:hypothetical protein
MVDTGEVSGNLTTLRAGQWVSMSGVVLELVQQASEAAVRVLGAKRTQYDGGFLFDMVPPGEYIVRLHAGQHLQEGEMEATEIAVVITADHLMVDGINLRVQIPVAEREKTGDTESVSFIEVRQ